MKKEFLLLVNDFGGFFPKEAETSKQYDLYKAKIRNKYVRIIRKMHLMTFLPFKNIWFSNWTKIISNFESIIIFDTGNVPYIAKYLRKKYPDKRIIVWYWGPVEISVNPKLMNKNKYEVWSFDERDCNKYEFKFNTQFYFKENIKRVDTKFVIPKSDICFVGTEKNRLSMLLKLETCFNDCGLKTYFHIVKSNSHYENNMNFSYKKAIDYPQLLACIQQSKAVLDIIASDQFGMTLRPLEALYFKKKLITNDQNIIYRNIYNSNNIFVIGIDDFNRLYDFINSEYDESSYEQLIEYYSVKAWLNRF